MMKQIIHQLSNSDHIFIATHANPDGDAIGSLIAMGLALDALGKDTTLYCESSIPAVYRFLPNVNRITHHVPAGARYDAALILDCGSLERIGEPADRISQVSVIINVDHHYTNSGFGHLHYIAPSACATTEIVYQLIKALGVSLNQSMATCIYTGILTDTGSFRFSNTNRAAFFICDEMVGLGVKPDLIAQFVYGTYSLGRLKLLNMALDSIEISPNGQLSLMVVTREMMNQTGTDPFDADGLINYARSIENVKLAAMIQSQYDDRQKNGDPAGFHVSLRSNGSVDAAAVAGLFGGGGHFSAAGFHIDATLVQVKKRLFDLAMTLERWEPKVCVIPEWERLVDNSGERKTGLL
ncbi:MAG: bifunctional oligoribonuclease/PAP phosphatase NrnA [Deltaproteobacteria bacterium]|nr:bifunctional oligoribonuclease/PAP phosphatase NrnA [Deltaproteobacteria bacterium]